MNRLSALLVAPVVVISACSQAGSATAPSPTTSTPTPTTVTYSLGSIPLFESGMNPGQWGNWPFSTNPNQPLTAGEVKVKAVISGGSLDLYLVPRTSLSLFLEKCFKFTPLDCSLAIGTARAVNDVDVVVGSIANINHDLVYFARDARVSGGINISITGPR